MEACSIKLKEQAFFLGTSIKPIQDAINNCKFFIPFIIANYFVTYRSLS